MNSIILVDFGSQTCHLIGRRLKDLGIEVIIVDPEDVLSAIKKYQPKGIILSGGPSSVYEKNAPTINKKIFSLNIPILGICYGWQLTAYLLGGKVESGKKEYGPANLKISDFDSLFYGFPKKTSVWESHGDTVTKIPNNFITIASTESVSFAAVKHNTRNIFGIQFHPESSHTEKGGLLFNNFITRICKIPLVPKKINVEEIIQQIKEKVGERIVIGAFSGGTDSAVAGALVTKAIGKKFIPIYIESGLMRQGTIKRIKRVFPKLLGMKVKIIMAKKNFLETLKRVVDPEQKRKAIGKLYIQLFEKELINTPQAHFLMQGTTYADFIHSKGTKHAAYIKSHHNVGGLPKDIKLELLEPLKYFYTDQVREIGLQIGLPKDVVFQQPFPGPGHAVRILGEVTAQRLEKQVLADAVLVDEMKKSKWYEKVFQCWTILTNSKSTAVKGDTRFFGDVVAIRIVNSKDRMSASWVDLPYDVLQRISTRIVNEVPGISRVVYDITTKPPATMEWE
ncbi:glutamine-hydrolyzing GMP synthase [Candidatus Roizmanbacteria bacterium CG01_land_8_20_14_3_00_33_9]|uniref:GMP synthase [glutamine-hydrolyzing] n=2 Tax=Candidatus Roizmaniibacteriota TaxID=1752723 RepID=A0A2M7E4A3_9BACT|nr:MAG: glutamine-hydrolyzing GMP synthase [Candidatus Roizmanbacteria bacterium CG01_land_8_20_14_3_00_33_9]